MNSTSADRIRRATLADAPELARLRWEFRSAKAPVSAESFPVFAAGFATFLADALAGDVWAIWVAERAGRLIANVYVQIVRMVPRPGAFDRRYGYVTNVYAEPAVRGAGVGAALLASVVTWAHEQRLEFLVLWPSEQSVAFYERAGFVPALDAMELDLPE